MSTTQTSHTPGPWRIGQSRAGNEDHEPCEQLAIYNRAQGVKVAKIETWIGRVEREESEANARLIASAPLMYGQLGASIEALRDALRSAAAADYDMVHALISGVIAGHELVLAKAEGGQP